MVFIICVIGPPGSGKGTLCAKLADEHGLFHFSVPSYLKELSCPIDPRRSSDRAAQVLQHRRELLLNERLGSLVKDKITKEVAQGTTRFVIEGFPRELPQALGFESEPNRLPKPDIVICLKCPKARAKARYVGRDLVENQALNEQAFEKQYRDFEMKETTLKDFYRGAGLSHTLQPIKSRSTLHHERAKPDVSPPNDSHGRVLDNRMGHAAVIATNCLQQQQPYYALEVWCSKNRAVWGSQYWCEVLYRSPPGTDKELIARLLGEIGVLGVRLNDRLVLELQAHTQAAESESGGKWTKIELDCFLKLVACVSRVHAVTRGRKKKQFLVIDFPVNEKYAKELDHIVSNF
ncbi:cytidine monophosphate (UMP-CMP) kinase 1, cytosolic [Ascosphaera aggregata]|nr:cytidine monophosphate (UMP-CMP) kinase 1, cytosolic [Ascosphaera aggregata]